MKERESEKKGTENVTKTENEVNKRSEKKVLKKHDRIKANIKRNSNI